MAKNINAEKIQGDLTVNNITGTTLNLSTEPTNNDTLTKILVRNSNGNIEYRNASSIGLWTGSTGANSIVNINGNNTATGNDSFVFGVNNAITSSESTQFGTGNQQTGTRNHGRGYYNVTNGNRNIVDGEQNTVNVGDNNVVNGRLNVVNGSLNSVFGSNNLSNADGTFVDGFYNVSNTAYEHILGRYNKLFTGSTNDFILTDPIFTIGNGTNDGAGRANAFQILKNGKIQISFPDINSVSDNLLTYGADGFIQTRDKKSLFVKNTYTVSETGGDFTNISDAIDYINNMDGTQPITIKLDSENHILTAPKQINSTHKITILGAGINACNIYEEDDFGATLFTLYTPCDFNGINFVGFAKTSTCISTADVLNIEILNCNFTNFDSAITVIKANVFVHNFVIENCNFGIYMTGAFFNKIDSEVGNFTNCGIGVYLEQGVGSIFDISSCIFSPTLSGNTGIVYVPATYTYSDHPSIHGCKWTNDGVFFTGFEFSRADGRDKDIVIDSNIGSESKLPHAYLNLTNNLTTTTLSSNVWTKVNFTGTTVYQNKINFTGNRFTYLPTNRRDLKIWGSGALTTSTSQANIDLAIVKNGNTGAIIAPVSITLDQNDRKFQWSANGYLDGVVAGDYFEIFARSASNETFIFEDFNWLIESM